MTTVVYSTGLCYTSACTDDTDDEATAAVNLAVPTGISTRWVIDAEAFRDGSPNPHPCEQDPARRHVLFSC